MAGNRFMDVGIYPHEICWNHFKNIQLKFDQEKSRNHCHICGGNKKLFVCCNKDCFSAFCKGCIKRNVSSSLLDVEKEDWKCFICNPKPIWDLRAVCAAVMDSLSKKDNKKSFNKMEKRSLPSQIQRREKMGELQQRSLQKLCDKEDDDSSEKSFVSVRITPKNHRTNPNTSSIQQKQTLEVDLTYSSESEDLSRARNENSTALAKRNKGERDQKVKSIRNSSAQKVSKSVAKEKTTSKKSKISSDSDDDSTHTLPNKIGKHTVKRNRFEKIKRKTNSRIHSSDSESDENDTNRVSSVFKRILKDTRQRNKKMDNFYNAKSRDRTKKYDLTIESEDEDKKRNRRERSETPWMIPHNNNDERKRVESSKQRLSDIQKDDSDNSFGKECQKIKLQKVNRNKYSRRQLIDLDVDHTKSPKNSTNDQSGKDINEQSNLNVSYIKKILTGCKKTCLNFQMYIEKSIEQLYGKQENEEQLVLQSIEKIDNLITTLKKNSKNLTTWQLWSRNKKKSTMRRKLNKIVSDNEQYLEEREKHTVSMDKHISGDEQDGNKAVFECESEEIFSADEIRSPQKIQTTGHKVARTENNLNNNETNTDDENKMLVDESKNNDKNNVDTRDDLAASPVLGVKERRASMELSNKKQVSSECNKSINKTQLTDENTKQTSLNTDNQTEIEDSSLRSSIKKVVLGNDETNRSNRKNIINVSMDMFETSPEDAEESRTEVELNVETNCDKDELLHSKDTSLNPCKSSLQDTVLNEKEGTSLLTADSGKGKDLSNQDNQEKVASVSAFNEEADTDLNLSGKTNIDDSESLDDAEALAKKALLVTYSDSDTISDENIAKPIEDLIANDTDRTEIKDATDHNNSDVNSVSAVKFSTLVKETSTDAEKNTAIEAKTKAEEKKNDSPDKRSCQEMNSSEDEDAKAEKATKKVLLESNLNDSTFLSLSSKSKKLVDKKTESDSSEKNAKAKLWHLASFSESSSSEMANISRSTKRAHEPENDRESIVSRINKRRFKLDKNHYCQNNETLRMSCEVHLTQLNTKVFKSYSCALRKSREYLEHKALK
ncbi:PREDICTED: transcriptional regulator ATRX-like, partial [Wasmannia auropunctata]|uniref:transcriptional regulator ATRX-like n=1 Tax=Wasmannia auropunctata TaxID=64793 RepID=UPI0005F010A0